MKHIDMALKGIHSLIDFQKDGELDRVMLEHDPRKLIHELTRYQIELQKRLSRASNAEITHNWENTEVGTQTPQQTIKIISKVASHYLDTSFKGTEKIQAYELMINEFTKKMHEIKYSEVAINPVSS